jgi:anti-anti-sigma regulatory factor
MGHGLAVRQFAEQGLAGGATALLMDLRHCTHMDSTFLGTLLFLKHAMDCRQLSGFALMAPSVQCRRLLEQMALAEFFPVVAEQEVAPGDWVELTANPDDPEAFQRHVVQAHVELARLPGAAGQPFQEVARRLVEDMEAKRKK